MKIAEYDYVEITDAITKAKKCCESLETVINLLVGNDLFSFSLTNQLRSIECKLLRLHEESKQVEKSSKK